MYKKCKSWKPSQPHWLYLFFPFWAYFVVELRYKSHIFVGIGSLWISAFGDKCLDDTYKISPEEPIWSEKKNEKFFLKDKFGNSNLTQMGNTTIHDSQLPRLG